LSRAISHFLKIFFNLFVFRKFGRVKIPNFSDERRPEIHSLERFFLFFCFQRHALSKDTSAFEENGTAQKGASLANGLPPNRRQGVSCSSLMRANLQSSSGNERERKSLELDPFEVPTSSRADVFPVRLTPREFWRIVAAISR
jgi:hypothetical protein